MTAERLARPTDLAAPPATAYREVPVMVHGGAGFIGRWVARLLSKHGARLHITARDPGSVEGTLSRYGIEGTLHALDILDGNAVEHLHAAVEPAITFNLVGYGIDHAETDPERAMAVNAGGVRHVLGAIDEAHGRDWRGCRLVHVGSGAEYGPHGAPFHESGPETPASWYGRSKLEGTQAVREHAAETGIPMVTARPFTVYGPGEHEGRLLPTLVNAARSGASVPLTEGRQRRDFVYVVDVAEALLRLGLSRQCSDGGAVNVATGQVMSVRAFALTAARVLGIEKERLEFGARTPGRDLDHGPPTTERLGRCTGWIPATNVEEGIRRTWRILDRIGE